MSIEVSSFDQNIVYLNFEMDGDADTDQQRCEVERKFVSSPLLSSIDKYVCSVSRFTIPTHTVYMNDHVDAAAYLTTWDPTSERVAPALNVHKQLAGEA